MPKSIYSGDNKIVEKIKCVLGKNVTLATKTHKSIFDESKPAIRQTKLKGIAVGNDGLVFTFENNLRHVLEIGDEITISKHFVTFVDSEGNNFTITRK